LSVFHVPWKRLYIGKAETNTRKDPRPFKGKYKVTRWKGKLSTHASLTPHRHPGAEGEDWENMDEVLAVDG
jgi:hypothetical protein